MTREQEIAEAVALLDRAIWEAEPDDEERYYTALHRLAELAREPEPQAPEEGR